MSIFKASNHFRNSTYDIRLIKFLSECDCFCFLFFLFNTRRNTRRTASVHFFNITLRIHTYSVNTNKTH